MKQTYHKTLSVFLTLLLLWGLAVPAAASEALGEPLRNQDTLLNEETQLSTNVFWSTTYSDLRTENLITYVPNREVVPIVTYGDALTDRSTVTAMAQQLEAQGYRVVAGFNGDFYNTGTGLPIGLVVADGELRSSDAGYYAIGFKKNGSAVLGKPGIQISADLGYGVSDGFGGYTPIIRLISAINKARVSEGGIYLYTQDFNAKRTNGTTEPGVDVVCSVTDGELAIGGTLTLAVEQVLDGVKATPVSEGQVVLSVNLKSNSYYVDALRNIPVGTEITVTMTAADEEWNEVRYAVGALYSLVENGEVVSGLAAGSSPRTAIGQRPDGTLVFYTIDGRKSGHSIGASLTQVGKRLIELGCETALCLDGGGSTTLAVTEPDELTAKAINMPSEGSERAVTNQIFLVADSDPSGRLSHFYVNADQSHVLAGSKVNISAAAVDTHFIPMNKKYTLQASDGVLDGSTLMTPEYGGEIRVTAAGGGKSGTTTVYAVAEPDHVAIRNSNDHILTELTVVPGTITELKGSVSYNHLPLYADSELFSWSVSREIGRIDEDGAFKATAPGEGTITVYAGGKSTSIPVTVSKVPLKTVEDFESADTIFSDGTSEYMAFHGIAGSELVRLGRGAGQFDYVLTEEMGYSAYWHLWSDAEKIKTPYDSINLWVCGDGSGNQLAFQYDDGQELPFLTLDFVGWEQVSVELPEDGFAIQGVKISAGEPFVYDDGQGNLITAYPSTARMGTIYMDQIVASLGGAVDNEVPVITAELDPEAWAIRAEVYDAVDDVLAESAVSVFYNGSEMEFEYDRKTGEVTAYLPGPGESYEAMRVSVVARDASGNIGRASVDVEPFGVEHKFTDINEYWGATFVDFLYNSGITTGYADGTFRPNQNISRAQFAVMLYRYLGLDETLYADVELPFADNAKIPEYAIPAIQALYTEGVINGSTGKDGLLYFNPNNSLTRAQAATMIGRTQEKGYAAVELSFSDAGRIPAYAQFYIQTMAAQGIIGGYTDGTFKPNNNITRGQMAKILYNLM